MAKMHHHDGWKGLLLGALFAGCTFAPALAADDTFKKGTDKAPATPTTPFADSDGGLGGIPIYARQVGQGADGRSVALGTEARPLTLPELLDEALRHNPTTRTQWEQTLAAVANVGVARAGYFPTVTLQGAVAPSHQTTPGYQGGGNADTTSYGPALTIQYLLLDFGTRAAGVEAARFQLLAANYTQNANLQSIILNVARNYYPLDGAKEQVADAEVSLQFAQASAESARRRAYIGLGTQTALYQAEQNAAQAKYTLESTRGQLATAQVNLATSLGLPGNAVLYVAPPANLPTADQLSAKVDDLIDKALRQRPDLSAKYAVYKQDRAAAKQADANILPQVTLGATLQRSYYHTTITGEPANIPGTLGGNGSYNGHVDDASAQLTFSVDLFDGWYKVNQARLARRQADAAQADLETSELAVISDVVAQFVAYRTALEQYSAGEALLQSSQKSFDSASVSYKAGLASILDLLTAQSGLASAKATLATARTSLFTASAQLANATGALLPQSVPHNAAATPTVATAASDATHPLP